MPPEILRAIAEILYPCPPAVYRKETVKEKYYNEKYPKKDIYYNGRVIPTTKSNIEIDLRNFFNPNDSKVRGIVDGLGISRLSDDEKALKCLLWVIDNIKYVGDEKKGYSEFWQFAFETLYYKTGDCEDGAILLANMMLSSGIPYWKVRLSAGKVKEGGHAYLTYYCEIEDRWVVLDWSYSPSREKIRSRIDYKDDKNYLGVWFSWNERYCFSKGLNADAKELLNK